MHYLTTSPPRHPTETLPVLPITGPAYRSSAGVPRRSFLKAGFLGLAGLTLADVLRLRADQAARGEATKDTSIILVWKGGGPSHIDPWDLNPEPPAEYRGKLKPIATNVQGIQISEHLPRSA